MLGRGILLIVLVPLIELVLLHQLLERTNLGVTFLVVLLTGIVGVSLARRQGMNAWRSAHQQMAQGRSPSSEIMDGVMILIAGAFLMTPGLLTDTAGFSLLIPQVRQVLSKRLTTWFKARTVTTFQNANWSVAPAEHVGDGDLDEAPSVRVVEPVESPPPGHESQP